MSKRNKRNATTTPAQANHQVEPTVTVHEHDDEVSTTINLQNFMIKDKDGDGYSMLDILREAVELGKVMVKVEAQGQTFSHHMVLMGDKAGSPETFRALCAVAEERLRLGRAPQGTPKKEKLLWSPMPQVYSQYKSRMITALEAGIKPLVVVDRVRKLAKPDSSGNTTKIEKVTLDSVAQMDKERRILENIKVAQEAKNKPKPTGGVIVDDKGEQHAHSAATITDESNLIDQVSPFKVDEFVLEAGLIDPRLAGILSRLIEGYEKADEDTRSKVITSLKRLTGKLNSASAEVKEQAKAVA